MPSITTTLVFILIFATFPQYGVMEMEGNIRILHVNEETNYVADKAVETAVLYLNNNPAFRMSINAEKVIGNRTDAKGLLDSLCKTYSSMLTRNEPPHIILDTTLAGLASETVKSFSSALALPTISASYKRDEEKRQWRNRTETERKYLIHILPPADCITEIIRDIISVQNIHLAAFLVDESFIMDYKLKSILIQHVMVRLEPNNIKQQLIELNEWKIPNYFILGTVQTIDQVLNVANDLNLFSDNFAWYAITQSSEDLRCSSCTNATIMYIRPMLEARNRSRFEMIRNLYQMNNESVVTAGFYFDITLNTAYALKKMIRDKIWSKNTTYISCDDYNGTNTPKRVNLNLRKYFNTSFSEPASFGSFEISATNASKMIFNMTLQIITIANNVSNKYFHVGNWKAGYQNSLTILKPEIVKSFKPYLKYRIVTVVQKPFIFKDPSNPKGFNGYCIDLINAIAEILGFDYDIYAAPAFGHVNEEGEWDGVVRELLENRAEIALGSMSIMSQRESIIDYTVPYYEAVGLTILMKMPTQPVSLFKFLTVLEKDVWFCIFGAYVLTSLLMWIFDRWSPYSYQNNRNKFRNDELKRVFNLRECFWFCIMSLTPQGGGEPPKNLSGRLAAATWWLFGFIIIASYTANLAAFLTVSRLDTPVESLDDLSKQFKITYAPINGTNAMFYFQRMAEIEQRFYEIWKDMSLNINLSPVERNKLAVWEYPVSEKYTKMWQTMKEAGLPSDEKTVLELVRASKSSSEGFAYLGDATDIKYLTMTNCDLQMIGEEFSKKSYALGVQQGSPIKVLLNNAILQLLNNRFLEELKEKWWTNNPERKNCQQQEHQSNGISTENIGGVFIILTIGICFACSALVLEYWWYIYRRHTRISITKTA